MSKSSSNKRSSRCHTCGAIRVDEASVTGIHYWPNTGPYTESVPEEGVLVKVPGQCGLELVDPTNTQGTRTLTNIKCSVVFADHYSDEVSDKIGFVGILIKYPQNTGLGPFSQVDFGSSYINNHDEIDNNWQSKPSFIPQSMVIDTFNLSNDTYPALEHFVPGPVVLESGDHLIFVVANINYVGTITDHTNPETHIHTRTITAQPVNFNCFVTIDYNISF